LIRAGSYGDQFGARPDGLSLTLLQASPHGTDLGPLVPRIPELLNTQSGKIELAPEPIRKDVERLVAALEKDSASHVILIGRRDLRSNNSWMHNLPMLMTGRRRCTLQVNPEDAQRFGLTAGSLAR